MKHLTIVVPNGDLNLSSTVGPYKIFCKADDYWRSLGNRKRFQIQLAGLSGKVDLFDGLFSITPHVTLASIRKTDLVIIPAIKPDFAQSIRQNKALITWLVEQYRQGAEVASICTGAFLLAATGLVNGKQCSTHWMAADALRNMFPEVELATGKLITDENGIYTNGGAFSFLNLMLYLVEKYYDRNVAIYCSKIFQIEIDRDSQSPFTIFTAQKNHDDDVVKQAQDMIEKNPCEKISVEHLASRFAVSRRNFDRRFVKATGNTPLEYLQRVKIEVAKKALETSRKTINEVMYNVGYSDVKAFREVFRKITGLSPLEYRGRYNKELAVRY